jgi:hypothetical protein
MGFRDGAGVLGVGNGIHDASGGRAVVGHASSRVRLAGGGGGPGGRGWGIDGVARVEAAGALAAREGTVGGDSAGPATFAVVVRLRGSGTKSGILSPDINVKSVSPRVGKRAQPPRY